MNAFEYIKQPLASVISSQVAMVLILSMLLWASGAPLLLNKAEGAQLTLVSDTLTDSDPGVATKHVIRFTTATSTIAGQTIDIIFDPVTDAFSQTALSATTTQITASGMTIVDTCTGAASEVTVQQIYTAGNEGVRLTVCATDNLSSGAKQINLGTSTPFITNPSTTGSYRVIIDGSWDDYGETRVAIIDDVVVTASVNTSFTFTISGLATTTDVNGEATTDTASSTYLAFGTLTPGAAKVLGQQLSVTTNAANGFSVTVVQDQNLLSATGADIDLFNNGATTSVPEAWAVPDNNLGEEWTYGHIGVTSEDTSLSAGDEFGNQLFAGNFNTARQVFYHNGPSDGTTAHIGRTEVAYKVEIGSLQEAGTDYTNTLTYVATPTF